MIALLLIKPLSYLLFILNTPIFIAPSDPNFTLIATKHYTVNVIFWKCLKALLDKQRSMKMCKMYKYIKFCTNLWSLLLLLQTFFCIMTFFFWLIDINTYCIFFVQNFGRFCDITCYDNCSYINIWNNEHFCK